MERITTCGGQAHGYHSGSLSFCMSNVYACLAICPILIAWTRIAFLITNLRSPFCFLLPNGAKLEIHGSPSPGVPARRAMHFAPQGERCGGRKRRSILVMELVVSAQEEMLCDRTAEGLASNVRGRLPAELFFTTAEKSASSTSTNKAQFSIPAAQEQLVSVVNPAQTQERLSIAVMELHIKKPSPLQVLIEPSF